MLSVILAISLLHFSSGFKDESQCKSFFPKYQGKVFVPLVGLPFKDKAGAVSQCKLLNGKPANLYSSDHMKIIINYIEENLLSTDRDHIDLRLGMSNDNKMVEDAMLRFDNGTAGPINLQNNWMFSYDMKTDVVLRVNGEPKTNFLFFQEYYKPQEKFLYRVAKEDSLEGVLCEVGRQISKEGKSDRAGVKY